MFQLVGRSSRKGKSRAWAEDTGRMPPCSQPESVRRSHFHSARNPQQRVEATCVCAASDQRQRKWLSQASHMSSSPYRSGHVSQSPRTNISLSGKKELCTMNSPAHQRLRPVSTMQEFSLWHMSDLVARSTGRQLRLGLRSRWPDSLKATVRILLTSGFPMWMAWGPELTFLYNDAYARTTLGKKHPWALGRPASEVWPEIWKEIGPRIRRVMHTGEASWEETLLLILERNGYPEETYHTFSYSPLTGPPGQIAGMLCVVIEDTVRVIGDRQVSALSTLAAAWPAPSPSRKYSPPSSMDLPTRRTCHSPSPISSTRKERLLGWCRRTGIEPTIPPRPRSIDADGKDAPWPHSGPAGRKRAQSPWRIYASAFPDLPTRLWDTAPGQARMVPISRTGTGNAARYLHRRAQSIPPARRQLCRISGPGCGPDCGQHHQRPGIRGRTQTRRKTGRAGPCQDRILQQCKPRVAHSAHADPGPG